MTEMVYEEISDDEQTPQSTLPKTVSNTSVKSDTDNHKESGNSKKKSSSKQTTATASKGQQKSMMSYFTKK